MIKAINCVKCGASLDFNILKCPYCGTNYIWSSSSNKIKVRTTPAIKNENLRINKIISADFYDIHSGEKILQLKG